MLALWLILLGISLVVGKKTGGKWFLKKSKNAALWPLKAGGKALKAEIKALAKQFWNAHRIRILSFCFGAGAITLLMNPVFFFWVLGMLLITFAGLLFGFAFATWRGAQDDFREWFVNQARWLWTRYGTQIRWGIAGAITLTILKLA